MTSKTSRRPRFIFDAHLDLSMNALEWNRDLTQPVPVLREREKGQHDKPDRGRNTVSLPAMREGNIGLCTATLIARYVKPGNPLPGWHSPEQAWAQTQGQLAWYRAMEARGEMTPITDRAALAAHLRRWENDAPDQLPIGYILSLEGADSIIDLSYLEKAYAAGLRALGPAHYGPGVYAYGTDSEGPLGARGRALLQEMDRLGIILDITHLCDTCFREALDIFKGPVWASHHNCRALVPHNRQLSDEQIKVLLERDAVIGAAFDAWMLIPGWLRGKTTPESSGVSLQHVADHIDHVCQLAGNALHAAIGTDLDGGYGREQSPGDLDTIAGLQQLEPILLQRGYSDTDIDHIFYQNWIRFLEKAWD
ncbi:dipeptidase [Compostibacter hankyongensis]|uniref:Membrane dipeptidase n=1 Tax=Compostibacter hankyongensis TaxID=1007089 RepID=A0ABP8G0B6_9BACT